MAEGCLQRKLSMQIFGFFTQAANQNASSNSLKKQRIARLLRIGFSGNHPQFEHFGACNRRKTIFVTKQHKSRSFPAFENAAYTHALERFAVLTSIVSAVCPSLCYASNRQSTKDLIEK